MQRMSKDSDVLIHRRIFGLWTHSKIMLYKDCLGHSDDIDVPELSVPVFQSYY